VSASQFEGCVSNLQTLSDSPWCSLGKIVSLNCPGKKHISGAGVPLIAVPKIIKKHFLAHFMPFFNVRWDIFNKCHKLYQGRSQDFSKGVAEIMEAKAMKRKNYL